MNADDIAALRNLLCEFVASRVDAYAEVVVPNGVHPNESDEYATYPIGEWEDAGPWQPYAAWDGHRGWRRPLWRALT